MKKMCSFEIKCPALKPTYIPEEWEPHPDTKRLDFLLRYIGFEKSGPKREYVYIDAPSELELRLRLERAWRQIDSNDPRDIIDKAMEDE